MSENFQGALNDQPLQAIGFGGRALGSQQAGYIPSFEGIALFAQELLNVAKSPNIPEALRTLSAYANEAADIVTAIQERIPGGPANEADPVADERKLIEAERFLNEAREHCINEGRLSRAPEPGQEPATVNPVTILSIVEMAAKMLDLIKKLRQRKQTQLDAPTE